MSASADRDRLRGPLEESLGRWARARAASDERRSATPPRPGDIFVFAVTAERSVLWLVAEHDPDQDRFLAVPADSTLLTGSADVAVPAEAQGGALSIRCAFGVWLVARDFVDAKRTGFVEPEILERVRQKRTEIEAGHLIGSLLDHSTDAELEYQDWMEVVKNAELKLFQQLRRHEAAAFSSTPKARPPSIALRIAASVFLVTSLFLLARVFSQQREIAQLESRLASAGGTGSASGLLQAQVNVPVILLERGVAVRGEAQVVKVPYDSSSLLLIFNVDASFAGYRLRIRSKATGTTVWSNNELTKRRVEGLTALLPFSILPPGEYQLDLHGIREGQPEPVERYTLRIESESSSR